MKLFDKFEAIYFFEENLIFITRDGFLYYIYDPKYNRWRKHRNAGNDCLTVCNYDDVRREVLMDAMGGYFPKKETDFMRLCDPSQLCIRDMLELFREDYPKYMSNANVKHITHKILLSSRICYRSYERLRKLFDQALDNVLNYEQVISQLKELSLAMIGRDVFRPEIGIVDGHDGSSYFWIMPVRVVDYSDTDNRDSVAEMRSNEISIEEDDVAECLSPFLYKYFDNDLEANKHRSDAEGFDWNLAYNFFTHDSIANVLKDISDTMDALASGTDNEYTARLRERHGKRINLIIDFYRRFIYRMEYMMRVGKEKGFDLISFMGP